MVGDVPQNTTGEASMFQLKTYLSACQIGQASCMNVKVFSCLQASWTWWLLFLWLAPQAPELLSHAFCKKPQHFHWPSPQQKHSPCNWLCFHRPFLVPNLDWVSPEAQGKFRNVFRWGNKPMTTKPAGKHKHWSHDSHIIQKAEMGQEGWHCSWKKNEEVKHTS